MRIFSIAALLAVASAIKLRSDEDAEAVENVVLDKVDEEVTNMKKHMKEMKDDAEAELEKLKEEKLGDLESADSDSGDSDSGDSETEVTEVSGEEKLAQKGKKSKDGDDEGDDKPDEDDEGDFSGDDEEEEELDGDFVGEDLDLEFDGEKLEKVKEALEIELAQEMSGESDEVKGDGLKGDKPSKDGDFSDDSEGDSDLEYLEELDAGELVEEFLGCLELKKEMEDVAAEFDITLETGLAQEVGEDFEGLSDEDKRAKVKDCLLKKKEIEGKIDEAFEEMEE